MSALRVLGILVLIATGIMILCAFSGSSEEVIGLWVLTALGLAVAQAIVGIAQPQTKIQINK